MKKYHRKIIIILVVSMLLCAVSLKATAVSNENQFSPMLAINENYIANFSIAEDVATISFKYISRASTFLRADISVKIQKRILGVYWRDVDIGYPDNIWTDSSIFIKDTFAKSFAVDGTGYYRALITAKFYGTTGAVDTIEVTKEFEYN